MRTLMRALVVSLLFAACVDSNQTTGADGASQGKADNGSSTTTGTYVVPVTDSNLANAARFTVTVQFTMTRGIARIQYHLPILLTGVPNPKVSMEGPVGEMLVGRLGTADCANTPEGMMQCHELLPGVAVDPVAVGEALRIAGASPSQIAQHTAVSGVFSSDPIGILEFAQR
jgi:hypothetical protein